MGRRKKTDTEPSNDNKDASEETTDESSLLEPMGPIWNALSPKDRKQIAHVKVFHLGPVNGGNVVKAVHLRVITPDGKSMETLENWDTIQLSELSEIFGGGPIRAMCFGGNGKIITQVKIDLPGDPRQINIEDENQKEQENPSPNGGFVTIRDGNNMVAVPTDMNLESRLVWIHSDRQLRAMAQIYANSQRDMANFFAGLEARQKSYMQAIITSFEGRILETQQNAERLVQLTQQTTNAVVEVLGKTFDTISRNSPTTGDASIQKMLSDMTKKNEELQGKLLIAQIQAMKKKGDSSAAEWLPIIEKMFDKGSDMFGKITEAVKAAGDTPDE